MRIGVIGVQGAVSEHIDAANKALKELGIEGEAFWMRKQELVDAVIIPGGESTTITNLMKENGLWDFVKRRAAERMPVLGTCAGMVILSKEGDTEVQRTGQELMGLLNCKVSRNAFGRQRESFEADLDIPKIGDKFRGVFIRAPVVEEAREGVEVLGKFNEKIVAVEQFNVIGISFHPELTDDLRIHKYFIEKVRR
jgi:5'-phosphate synthase pdxT subunit